jgi:hypothetical protein
MPETRQPRHIASAYCTQYETNAEFFIQDQHPSGLRHLVVQYENGGHDGRLAFAVAIPPDWTERDVSDLLLWPMKHPNGYPAWEIPSRAYGSSKLFRWWAGEKPD